MDGEKRKQSQLTLLSTVGIIRRNATLLFLSEINHFVYLQGNEDYIYVRHCGGYELPASTSGESSLLPNEILEMNLKVTLNKQEYTI